ncbi:MAG: hypothetical protein LBS01_04955 [Prevotellaceae bacterium]|jgi:hypothetical protein|nr:hypothetical protein [Prevotellaceae bacterium]
MTSQQWVNVKMVAARNMQINFYPTYEDMVQNRNRRIFTIKKGQTVTFTGEFYEYNDDLFFQSFVDDGREIWLCMVSTKGNSQSNYLTQHGSADGIKAQNYLADSIEYNRAILDNLLLCGYIVHRAKEYSKTTSAGSIQQMTELAQRLAARNAEIKSIPNIGYEEGSGSFPFNSHLEAVMSNPKAYIGIAWLPLVIVVTVLVGAAVAISVSLTKRHYLAAKSDFMMSDDLRQRLQKALPTDLYNQIVKEWNEKAAGASAQIKNLTDLANKEKWKKYLYIGGGVAVLLLARPVAKNLGLTQ